jgi:hypothetical protein
MTGASGPVVWANDTAPRIFQSLVHTVAKGGNMAEFVKIQVRSSTGVVDHWIDFEKVDSIQVERGPSGDLVQVIFAFGRGQSEVFQQGPGGGDEALKAFENYLNSRQP